MTALLFLTFSFAKVPDVRILDQWPEQVPKIKPAELKSYFYHSSRHLYTQKGDLLFDQAGFYLRMEVYCEYLYIAFEDPRNHFRIRSEGEVSQRFVPGTAGVVELRFKNEGWHSLDVFKATEFQGRTSRIVAMSVGSNQVRVSKSRKKILFVGDSFTVGYANRLNRLDCSPEEVGKETDAWLAFPRILADQMEMESVILAYSGRGVGRNFGDSRANPKAAMPAIYHQALFTAPKSKWQWPDKVNSIVVFLGLNDFSRKGTLSKEEFHEAYDGLLKTLKNDFPKAPIYLVGLKGHRQHFAVNNVYLEQKEKGLESVHFVELKALAGDVNLSCHMHPSTAYHAYMAKTLHKAMVEP